MALSVSAQTQVKLEWLDTYKNKPPAGIEKNDVSIVMALVFKH